MENENYKGMPQMPYPFWLNSNGENPWQNFPKPPFMNRNNMGGESKNPWESFMPPFMNNNGENKNPWQFGPCFGNMQDNRPELSNEDYDKIMKGVQKVLGFFFKKSNIDYTWED